MTPERRKRINRLKKMIMWTVLFMILFPTAGCIFLGIRLHQANQSLEMIDGRIDFLERALQESMDATDRAEALLDINEGIWRGAEAEQEADILEEQEPKSMEASGELSEGDEKQPEENRKVYLTFDDGPSVYTEELLDILAEYDVKATFFVTGKDKEKYADTYRRIVEEGHTLGMHSYSHEYSTIYASMENFQEDIELLRDFLYNETGVVSYFYRFPGGSSNQVSKTDIHEMIDYLNAMGIRYFDWNVSSGDAVRTPVSSDQIVDRVMKQLPSHQVAVVLMHDAGDKRSTVNALGKLIEEIQGMDDGTEILPITEETMLIQHVSGKEEDGE